MKYKVFNLKIIQNVPGYVLGAYRSQEADCNEEFIWDSICKYLSDKEKYVHHIISSKWTEDRSYPMYVYRNPYQMPEENKMEKTPCGDLVYIVKIYYEEK